MRSEATLTRRGQVAIPKAIREGLGIRPGDRISFTLMPDRTIPMRVKGRFAEKRDATRPVERYSERRVAEFDAAEAELRETLKRRRATKAATRQDRTGRLDRLDGL